MLSSSFNEPYLTVHSSTLPPSHEVPWTEVDIKSRRHVVGIVRHMWTKSELECEIFILTQMLFADSEFRPYSSQQFAIIRKFTTSNCRGTLYLQHGGIITPLSRKSPHVYWFVSGPSMYVHLHNRLCPRMSASPTVYGCPILTETTRVRADPTHPTIIFSHTPDCHYARPAVTFPLADNHRFLPTTKYSYIAPQWR